MTKEPRKTHTLLYLLAWLLFATLIGFVAWQLHATLLTVVAAWLNSDLPRPSTWATWTLAPISRASILVLGSSWLMLVIWLERDLAQRKLLQVFGVRVGKLLAWLLGVLALCRLVILFLA